MICNGDLLRSYFQLNIFIAVSTGILFFTGWWIFVDIAATNVDFLRDNKSLFVPGICGTISMIIVNLIPFEKLTFSPLYENTGLCPPIVRFAILFLALSVSFGMFIWSLYIAIETCFLDNEKIWPGIGILLQNLLILLSNLILKFYREFYNTESVF